MQRAELERHLDQILEVGRFRDYCPNGLQVEGRFAEQDVGFLGSAGGKTTAGELARQLAAKLGRVPMYDKDWS